MASTPDALKSCALFKDFTDTGLQIIAGISTERNYPKGVPLFVENMVADSMLIVTAGRVKLTARNPSGEEVALGTELGPGEALGELSLVQPSQRMCTATAATGVTAVELRHGDFQRLMAQKPQACLKLLMAIVGAFGQKVQDSRSTLKLLLAKS
ncbi:MAG TPA: cyclic nucleotide-binding domain-containing protein [Myxococcales bacterium]|jgi:CRP-like cAMP-binding protein|nr:cyclic nucleotide-binding domain-containing protein [Myxococcales bacterium]